MKRRLVFAIILAVCMAVMLCVIAAAVEVPTVVTATSTSSTKLSSLSVNKDGLFCGWFTTKEAAQSLDTSKAAKDGYAGTVYGMVIPCGAAQLSVIDAEIRTEEPVGVRFLIKIDKNVKATVERLNALNRNGRNGTLTPRTEDSTGIGYGAVLALDAKKTSALTKQTGATVNDGVTVAGVYTYAEDRGSLIYAVTVLGIDNASLASKIAVRPYITYADANGNERTVYYTDSTRANRAYAISPHFVAEMAVSGSATTAEKTAAKTLLASYTGEAAPTLTNIKSLNTSSTNGSADGDNVYLEPDRSTRVELDGYDNSIYKKAFYPRITKVKDGLFLMTFNNWQIGDHIYYTTSTDGINWGTPKLLYDYTKNYFTHTFGSMKGKEDRYYSTTADHCVLDDGTILCVYSRRPNVAYSKSEYSGLSTLELVKGTVSGTSITWSEPVAIYHGQNWEPEIIQRSNGNVEIYWTHGAPMMHLYGYHTEIRSSGVAMITSSDGGDTWTPNVTANDTNNYAGKRVLQTLAGAFTVSSGETVNFYNGQMPGVVELANGKLMMAVEARTVSRTAFYISTAVSGANGVWTELGIDEEGPSTLQKDLFKGAAPTLMRFVSGEILLTYNEGGTAYARLLNETGSNIKTAPEVNILSTTDGEDSGFWSCSAPVDAHTAIVGMSYKKYNGQVNTTYESSTKSGDILRNTTIICQYRLNHTINASKKTVTVDGNLKEWTGVKHALFVGSLDSKVQAAYRFAYDTNYIYIAIDRTDDSNSPDDTSYVNIATSSGYITVKASYGTSSLPTGVTGKNEEVIGGRIYELCLDRAALGLTGTSIRVSPGFTDAATGVDDSIDGTSATDTSTWIKINLN